MHTARRISPRRFLAAIGLAIATLVTGTLAACGTADEPVNITLNRQAQSNQHIPVPLNGNRTTNVTINVTIKNPGAEGGQIQLDHGANTKGVFKATDGAMTASISAISLEPGTYKIQFRAPNEDAQPASGRGDEFIKGLQAFSRNMFKDYTDTGAEIVVK